MGRTRKTYKTKKIGVLELKPLDEIGYDWCQTKHSPHRGRADNRVAQWSAYILGVPAGKLCKMCMKEWSELWEKYSTL